MAGVELLVRLWQAGSAMLKTSARCFGSPIGKGYCGLVNDTGAIMTVFP